MALTPEAEERYKWNNSLPPYDTVEGKRNAPQWLRDEKSDTGEHAFSQPTQQIRMANPRPAMRDTWYGNGKRTFYGLWWAGWTTLLTLGMIFSFAAGAVAPGLLTLVLAPLAGWYDYRIWTWQARHLWFFIIF